jgi:hypothetical protein
MGGTRQNVVAQNTPFVQVFFTANPITLPNSLEGLALKLPVVPRKRLKPRCRFPGTCLPNPQ